MFLYVRVVYLIQKNTNQLKIYKHYVSIILYRRELGGDTSYILFMGIISVDFDFHRRALLIFYYLCSDTYFHYLILNKI